MHGDLRFALRQMLRSLRFLERKQAGRFAYPADYKRKRGRGGAVHLDEFVEQVTYLYIEGGGNNIKTSLNPYTELAFGPLIDITKEALRLASIDDQRQFQALSELSSFADEWFNEGVLTFETGENAGVSFEIKRWVSSILTLELWESVRLEVQVGDQFRLYPGCRKRIVEDCRDRFRIPGSLRFDNGNALNFRGEPYVPGGGLSGMTPNAG